MNPLSLPLTPPTPVVTVTVVPTPIIEQMGMNVAILVCLLVLIFSALFYVVVLMPDDKDLVLTLEWEKKP